jgi:hypothetical protein
MKDGARRNSVGATGRSPASLARPTSTRNGFDAGDLPVAPTKKSPRSQHLRVRNRED